MERRPAADLTRQAADPRAEIVSLAPASCLYSAAAAHVAVTSSHERSRLGSEVPAALALPSSAVEIS